MKWMSSFIQPRDGRTNIKKVSDTKKNTSKPEKDELEKDEDDEEGMSLNEDDTLDYWEQPNQSFLQRKEDEEVCIEDKSPEPDGPSKSKKGKAPTKSAAKDALLEEMELSVLSKINSRMNERDKRRQNKRKVEKKNLIVKMFSVKPWSLTSNVKCPLWNSKCDRTALI